ncbi:alanine--glyoxylate aminotransferase 2, mitochondrial-like [Gigantopelta aegis]|uniref:alanine--glyoxylate aminotransferase 2, mitochondrial-like n=1 Tax=Gigantopelta aegis TaxID=1735272 RepID=UPI001B88B913|nr:alanine--glyoxylate aminotransferase 2, mitochondrial-like [Gigantopelta aegis]
MAVQIGRSMNNSRSLLMQVRCVPWRCMSALPQMPPCDFKPDTYTGISYERAQEVRKAHLNPALFTFYKKPVMIHQGHMQYLYDTEGHRYLDLFAGIVTISVGHCHPKVVEATHKQLNKLWHTTNIYLHPTIHEYAEKLAGKLPGDLKVVYFTNSGSESNDLALHMARLYTGVYDSVSLRNAYHGASPYLMGLTALSTWRYNTPTGFGIHQSMCPDVYRGPWGGSHCRDSLGQTDRPCSCAEGQCEAKDKYLEQLMDTFRFSMPKDKLGAFFIESIQGVGGTVQFPKGFVKDAFDLVRSKGGVCISDEVQCGFGRLGTHYWGFESHGVVPDIVTMAKGMGNGFPIGAVVTTPEIAKVMGNALHFNTFGGNPLSCAVGSSVIDVIDEEHIQEKANRVGIYFIKQLLQLKDEYDIVGDVRGKGLMLGMEMVTDKKSKEPMSGPAIAEIWENTKNMGLLLGKGGFFGNVFRIKPPMCITEEDVDFSVAVIRKAFNDYLNKVQ